MGINFTGMSIAEWVVTIILFAFLAFFLLFCPYALVSYQRFKSQMKLRLEMYIIHTLFSETDGRMPVKAIKDKVYIFWGPLMGIGYTLPNGFRKLEKLKLIEYMTDNDKDGGETEYCCINSDGMKGWSS